MAGKRAFYTGSTAIISDARLSGLDHRTYAVISEHDGMSLKLGKGRGCYATYATLTARLGCDASNLSKSIKRLVEWGYITEERQIDRRRKTYRVVFDFPESWRNDQQSMVGETANNLPNAASEIVGNGECGNGRNPPQDEQHYSSLKGLDTSEEEKLDSSEEARLAARMLGKTKFPENDGAQMARFERAWKEQQERFSDETLTAWNDWLSERAEFDPEYVGAPLTGRAQRLLNEIDVALWERKIGPYSEDEAA